MSEIVTNQGNIFAITILCGVSIGVFYDTLRIFRRIIKHSNLMINVEDGLFWIISSVFLFIILFEQNNGVLRGYIIIGVVVGMSIYFSVLSYYIVNGISKILKIFIKFLRNCFKIIIMPLLKISRIITKPIKGARSSTKRLLKNLVKLLKKKLKTIKIIIKKI